MNKEKQWLLKEKYSGVESPEYFADLKRLEGGEPLQYVIGWVDFLGCRIDLSLRPLIPRPETEFWVESVIKSVVSRQLPVSQSIKILDLFAGSGCIGVALAKHLLSVTVHFGEIDPALTDQIEKNIELNNVDPERTKVITTDVFSNIADSYDVIVANPPYIDPAKYDTVEKSVFLHEPHHALFAKDGGLALIKKLITDAPQHLNPDGVLYIEFGENQKEAVAELLSVTPFSIEFIKDVYEKWRVVKIAVT